MNGPKMGEKAGKSRFISTLPLKKRKEKLRQRGKGSSIWGVGRGKRGGVEEKREGLSDLPLGGASPGGGVFSSTGGEGKPSERKKGNAPLKGAEQKSTQGVITGG